MKAVAGHWLKIRSKHGLALSGRTAPALPVHARALASPIDRSAFAALSQACHSCVYSSTGRQAAITTVCSTDSPCLQARLASAFGDLTHLRTDEQATLAQTGADARRGDALWLIWLNKHLQIKQTVPETSAPPGESLLPKAFPWPATPATSAHRCWTARRCCAAGVCRR